jgi:hypothetical protein
MRNERADDPAVLADLVVAHLHVANVYRELDRNDDGLAVVELAVTLTERLRRDYESARKSAWQFIYKTNDPRLSMLRKFVNAVGCSVKSLI